MAKLVFAAGVPHAPGLIGLLSTAPKQTQDVVNSMFAKISAALSEAAPDVLIIIGNDHLANSRPRTYPDFVIGMAPQHVGPYEWYKEWLGCRNYKVQGDTSTAELLFYGLNKRGFRMYAQRENLRFDDQLSIPAIHMKLDESAIRVIPILQNCTVPPIPDTNKCYELGRTIAEVISQDLPDEMRIGILGSGGLSHEPGGARYWYIDKEFDLWFLELMASGDHAKLLRDLTVGRMEEAGSGGTLEVLSWVVAAGAAGPRYGEQTDYALHSNFKCGIGGVIWDMARRVDQPLPVREPKPVINDKPDLLTHFNPSLASHDLVQDLKWNPELRNLFTTDESAVLDQYPLHEDERKAIEDRDFAALYALGFHPYLGGQLARLIYGNDAGKGATLAVQKLVESLNGQQIQVFSDNEGIINIRNDTGITPKD